MSASKKLTSHGILWASREREASVTPATATFCVLSRNVKSPFLHCHIIGLFQRWIFLWDLSPYKPTCRYSTLCFVLFFVESALLGCGSARKRCWTGKHGGRKFAQHRRVYTLSVGQRGLFYTWHFGEFFLFELGSNSKLHERLRTCCTCIWTIVA